MIVYNVTAKVQSDSTAEWVKWMKDEHIPALMRTGLFVDYRMCRLLEQDESDGTTYTIQYYCDSLEHYHSYIKEHAPAMREKSQQRFGNRYIAFRTVMEVIS